MKTSKTSRRHGRLYAALCFSAAALSLVLQTSSCTNPLVTEVQTMKAQIISPKLTVAIKGGAAIANGDTYDFGKVSVTDPNGAQVTLVIGNTGKTDLQISNGTASISGTDAGAFSLVSALPAKLGPGASAEFSIKFVPATLLAKNASMSFSTNDVDNASYSLLLTGIGYDKAPMPVFAGGNYQFWPGGVGASVTIKCSNTNATIYYTKDGSVPSVAAIGSTTFKYEATFGFAFGTSLASVGTIRAIAQVPGMDDSSVATANFTNQPVPVPVLDPAGKTYMSGDTLDTFSMSAKDAQNNMISNALIAFTIDGTTAPSPETLNPFPVAADDTVIDATRTYWIANGDRFKYGGLHTSGQFTLRAVAFVANNGINFPSGEVTPATYHFKMSTPTFSGIQPSTQHPFFVVPKSVSLGFAGSGSITYTTVSSPTDLSDVTGASYTAAIPLAAGPEGSSRVTTITAFAHNPDWEDSGQLNGLFAICGPGKWDSSNWDEATWQ